MLDLAIHFERSIRILNALKYDLLAKFESEGGFNFEDPIHAFYHFSLQSVEGIKKKELIKEILKIEFEKAKLRDNKIDTVKIALKELKTIYQMDELLSGNDVSILCQIYSINPLVTVFESDWRFILGQESEKFDIIINLSQPKSNFFFLFQRIGIYDYIADTNVLEFELNKYECLLIRIFETPKTARKAILEFMNMFEYDHKNELEELTNQSLGMIKYLIFRRFIVVNS